MATKQGSWEGTVMTREGNWARQLGKARKGNRKARQLGKARKGNRKARQLGKTRQES